MKITKALLAGRRLSRTTDRWLSNGVWAMQEVTVRETHPELLQYV